MLGAVDVVEVDGGIIPMVTENGRVIPTGGLPVGARSYTWRTPNTIQPSTAYAVGDALMDPSNLGAGPYRCTTAYTSAASPVPPSQDTAHWALIGTGFCSLGATRTNLTRWQVATPLLADIVEDSAVAERAIDALINETWRRSLEVDVISGDGSSTAKAQRLVGILSTTGIGSVACRDGSHSTETNFDAISRAVNAVQDAGFYDRPLTVAAHPDSLLHTRTAKASTGGDYLEADAVLPDVKAWIPATTIAPNEAIVGAFEAVKVFVGGGVELQLSNNYEDFLTRGLVMARMTSQVLAWVGQPAAVAHVTGLT